ncbi:fibronectin type III domain-containing protein [Ruminococcus bicirculans (ex Wegman et al. 2014)]|uniref:fibronectin type III domain-containing protein n=1 Tax=Ruminococcus bicirculans (ex Wegman et al. 2014) TaxID=1160721 RepID=UPI00242AE95A|nr:fibronectin type III domain-containing protein [Ruminococcus bicirculans (ex Wegman et al. 2014)]
MNMKKRMLSIVLSGAMAVSTAVSAGSFGAFAVAQCVAYSGSNVNDQDYVQWSDTVKSYLTVCDNGNYMRVQSGAIKGKLLVEYYSSDFEPLSTKLIDNELPIFGAFYDSGNNYYVLSGQENPKQNDSLEVFRITKYDKNWNKIKSCGLYGANTTVPFDAGSARMTHSGDHLLVRTCHKMYKSSDGNNHQANVTIEVDMPSMTITDSYTGVMNVDYGYVSHSFNQFIKTDGNHIVALDHGDAHPRSAVLVKYNSDFTTGKFFPSYFEQVSNIDVVTYPEYTAGHYNYTGAAIGGFDVSSSSYIVAQSTVDLDYINTSETRNVYVSAVSKDLSTNKLNKITSYAEGTDSASAPQLVKINNNSFLLLWSRDTKVSCVKLNADGTVNGSIHTFEGSLSDCQPVIKNGRAVWYVYDKNNVTFNSLNLSNLDDIKTVDVKTGHDYETKYASKTDGTVTQTCKSCGYVNKFTVPTSTTVYWRTDLSNTSFSSVLSKTQFSVGDSIDFWLYDDTDYTVEFSDRSMVSVNKLENYANDIRRITFKNGGSLTVKIYPTYNPSVAKTYKFTCGCTSHTYGSAVIIKQPTCTAEGTKTKTCTKCGATVTETIAKLSHSYTATVVAPTCTADGYTLHKCSVCGTSYKDNTTKATGHSFGNSIVTKQPTCTSEGTAIKTCTKCNATVTETIPKTSHKYADTVVAPTCTAGGYTLHKCSVCGTSYKDNTTKATGHSYGNSVVTKQPTCTSEGTAIKTCTKCNATVTETIPKTSHKYADTVVAPTCTTNGYTLHKCSVCGASYKDSTTKATGHSYGNSVVTKQPTCTSEGTAIKTCTKCNATVTEKLPAKGHTAVTDKGYPATCTTAGKTDGSHCSVCNTVIKVQTVINATGHKSSGWITDKAASIGVKGSKHKECTVCKKVLETAEIPALSRISISKASVTLSTSTYAYDGKAKKPGVTVKLNGKTLKNGTDYTVSYSNNTKVGTAKVTITGKGNYTGSVSKTYSIKNNFKKATVSGISTKAFTGKNITQSITVKYNGKTLKNGTDYTVFYSNNKNIGTATVKITGKGSFTGTITKTFKINPAKQEIQKLTAKSKAFFVDWAQKGSATGYEIQYATNSKFTSAKKVTITNNKTDKTTISKLSGKKKYYVRVRSYTTVKGTKYYGAWSASKSVTTKK